MNDDELFRGLARAAREDDAANDAPAPDDPFVRAAQAPLGADARARIAARLTREVAQRGARPPAKVIPLGPSRLRYAALFAGAMAAAAGVALFVSSGGRTDESLPEYALVVSGGDRATRGADDPAVAGDAHLAPGSRVELLLRPKTRVEWPVEARGFLSHGGVVAPWKANIDVAEGGAVRIAGDTSTLFPGLVGPVEVAIAVGREGRVPSDATSALAPGRDGVHVVRWRAVLEPGN